MESTHSPERIPAPSFPLRSGLRQGCRHVSLHPWEPHAVTRSVHSICLVWGWSQVVTRGLGFPTGLFDGSPFLECSARGRIGAAARPASCRVLLGTWVVAGGEEAQAVKAAWGEFVRAVGSWRESLKSRSSLERAALGLSACSWFKGRWLWDETTITCAERSLPAAPVPVRESCASCVTTERNFQTHLDTSAQG